MKYRPGRDEASNRAPRRTPLPRLVGGYLLLFATVLALASFIGTLPLDPSTVWSDFMGVSESMQFDNWLDLRLVPLLFVAAVGAALSLSGVVFQAVLRNPLAEPYILGISGAAALGWLASRVFLPEAASFLSTASAFGGATLAVLLLLGLARWARLYDPPSLILAGAVLNAIFGAMVLLLYSVAPREQVVPSMMWLTGSIGLVDVATVLKTLAAVTLVAGVFIAVARYLDLLSLGEEEAADLGLAPGRFRVVALVVSSALTGIVAAKAGPIGFVGLVVPHIMRALHGPIHRRLIPLSLLGGGIFLMVAHTASRTVVEGSPLPLGAVTALVGGPFFLVLLLRRQRPVAHE